MYALSQQAERVNESRNALQRRAVVSILLLAQVALFCTFQSEFGSAIIVAGLAIAPWLPFKHRQPSGRTHADLLVLAGICFFLAGVIRLTSDYSVLSLFRLFAQYLLLVQAFELMRIRSGLDTNYLPGLAALTIALLMVSLDFRVPAARLAWIYAAFTAATFGLLRSDLVFSLFQSGLKRRKGSLLGMLAVFSMTFGSLSRSEIEQALPQMIRWISGYWDLQQENTRVDANSAFVQEVGLNSIAQYMRTRGGELVFSVYAPKAPGYMRTLSFDSFDGRSWRGQKRSPIAGLCSDLVPPTQVSSGWAFPETLYRVQKPLAYSLAEESVPLDCAMTVEVEERSGKLTPVPLNAVVLVGEVEREARIVVDRHLNVMPGEIQNAQYGVVTGPLLQPSDYPNYLGSLLAIPDREAEHINQIASEICQGSTTSSQQMQAIEKFFVEKFHYSLLAEPEENLAGRTALQAFLEERRDAHCEYFATAATLMLRARGIPARVSTGYLVYEMNESLDFYMATGDKAHAWVEAYDKELKRWAVLEPTPGIREYVERFDQTKVQASLRQARRREASIWSTAMEFWFSIRRLVFGRELQRSLWLVPLALPIALLIWRWQRRKRQRRMREFRFCSDLMLRADALAKSVGWIREPNETCHEFACRLREQAGPSMEPLAKWYRGFGEVRYLSETDEDRLPKLPKRRELRNANSNNSADRRSAT